MKKSELTRQMIVEKSAHAFNLYGYGNTSMSKLMEVTGLEKGGIYGHFGSKEELSCAAFDYATSIVIEDRFSEFDKIEGYANKLNAYLKSFSTYRASIPGGCPVFNTAVESKHNSPTLNKKAKEAYQRIIENVQAMVDGAIKEGSFKKVKSDKVARFIVNSIEGAIVSSRLYNDKNLLIETAENLIEYINWKCAK